MTQKPNIILIMADQFRYDAIQSHDNPYLTTPTFDMMISQGTDFRQAYSATPTCIPARASLLTGLSQTSTGLVGYQEGTAWDYPQFIATALAGRGYYCKAVGKMHVHPPRKLCGFHHIDLHDGYLHATRNSQFAYGQAYTATDDYLDWLLEQGHPPMDLNDAGLSCNSWVGRPFPYQERLHPTNWATSKAMDFIRKRDTSMPFFLKLSYVRPHSPLDPPEYYFNLYRDRLKDLPEPQLAAWVENYGIDQAVDHIDAKTGRLSHMDYVNLLAGYYGLITHMDHQINRFLLHLEEYNLLHNSIILFTSDHGDQLGQHRLFRKGFPYQGSIHVPLIVWDPGNHIASKDNKLKVVDQIVELRDILPSLVDFADGSQVAGVDGQSIKPLMIKDQSQTLAWRQSLHGEHVLGEFSNHYILSLPYKYIWYSQSGKEQLFNLDDDPDENHDILADYPQVHAHLRAILVDHLKNRHEGFVSSDQELLAGRPLQTYLSPSQSQNQIG